MGVYTLSEAFNSGAKYRSGSQRRGRCENGFWKPFDRADVSRLLYAAELYDLEHKQPGNRNGPLGPVGIATLRCLLRTIDYKTGQLEPSIATIMATIKRSRAAVIRALQALRDHGFIEWIRRFDPRQNEGPGPRIAQVTNAYRILFPEAAKRILGFIRKPAPIPDDFAVDRATKAAEKQEMLARLDVTQLGSAIASSDLGALLDRIGSRLAERESTQRTEPTPSCLLDYQFRTPRTPGGYLDRGRGA